MLFLKMITIYSGRKGTDVCVCATDVCVCATVHPGDIQEEAKSVSATISLSYRGFDGVNVLSFRTLIEEATLSKTYKIACANSL